MTDTPVSTIGAIRQIVVEYAALGDSAASAIAQRVYREEEVPASVTRPYVSILGPVADVPVLKGDARGIGWRQDVQLDLWQTRGQEDDRLVDALIYGLDGRASTIGLRTSVISRQRIPDDDASTIHDAITLQLSLLREGPRLTDRPRIVTGGESVGGGIVATLPGPEDYAYLYNSVEQAIPANDPILNVVDFDPATFDAFFTGDAPLEATAIGVRVLRSGLYKCQVAVTSTANAQAQVYLAIDDDVIQGAGLNDTQYVQVPPDSWNPTLLPLTAGQIVGVRTGTAMGYTIAAGPYGQSAWVNVFPILLL